MPKITSLVWIFLLALPVSGQIVTRFEAELSSDNVITAGVQGTPSTATGLAEFELRQTPGVPAETTLTYHFEFTGIDLDGMQTADILDDISALHLHNTRECSPVSPNCQPGDTALTQHVLNIFGAPRLDDADVVVDAAAGTISGIWDVSDTNLTFPPTLDISEPDTLDILFGGDMFVNVHTNQVGSGAIGGYLVQVPEPSAGVLGVVGWDVPRDSSAATVGCARVRIATPPDTTGSPPPTAERDFPWQDEYIEA